MTKVVTTALVALATAIVTFATPAAAGPFTGKSDYCVGIFKITTPIVGVSKRGNPVFEFQNDQNGTFLTFKQVALVEAYSDPVPALKGSKSPEERLVSPPQVPTPGRVGSTAPAKAGDLTIREHGSMGVTNYFTFTPGHTEFQGAGGQYGSTPYDGVVSCAPTREQAIAEFHF